MTLLVLYDYQGLSSLLSPLLVQIQSCSVHSPPAGHISELPINKSSLCFPPESRFRISPDGKPFAPCLCRSALQVLHKACEVSRRFNYFPGGIALTWMAFYESCITSEQSCVNEWNAMTDLESTRPDSPTMFVDR